MVQCGTSKDANVSLCVQLKSVWRGISGTICTVIAFVFNLSARGEAHTPQKAALKMIFFFIILT